jgi:O-antigen ligase
VKQNGNRDAWWLFLLLTVALVPVTVLKGPAQTAVVDVLSLIALPLFAAWTLVRRRRLTVPFLVPAFVIALASLLAVTNSVSLSASAITLLQDGYLFVWFLVLVNLLRDQRDATSFRIAWVWVANAVALFGLAVVLTQGHQSLGSLIGPKGMRATGTFLDPNMFADYLVLSLFLVISLSEETGRLFRWGSGLLLITAILASKSNGGITSLAVGLAVWMVARAWTLRLSPAAFLGRSLIVASLALAGVWLVQGYGVGKAQIGQLTNESVLGRAGHSSEGRFQIWTALLRRYAEQPLGIGPGNSRHLQLTMQERERPDSFLSKEAHNDYLGYLVERGPLALLALLALKLLAFGKVKTWWRGRLQQGLDSGGALAAAAMGAMAASLTHSFTLETLHFRHVWLFLALICALDGMVLRPRNAARSANRVPALAPQGVAAAAR